MLLRSNDQRLSMNPPAPFGRSKSVNRSSVIFHEGKLLDSPQPLKPAILSAQVDFTFATATLISNSNSQVNSTTSTPVLSSKTQSEFSSYRNSFHYLESFNITSRPNTNLNAPLNRNSWFGNMPLILNNTSLNDNAATLPSRRKSILASPVRAWNTFKSKDIFQKETRRDQCREIIEKYGVCSYKTIARGGYGTVKLSEKTGEDGVTKIVYAHKQFLPKQNSVKEKDYMKQVISEFCIASSLKHKNIVETFDLLQDIDYHWNLIMEYCPGGDLFSLNLRNAITVDKANGYLSMLLEGLRYMHEVGVVHRDLKPENLLIGTGGQLKISDFGNAEVIKRPWNQDNYKCIGPSGSYPYISPEAYSEQEHDGMLGDVWACGIIYCFLVSGRTPWQSARPPVTNYGKKSSYYDSNFTTYYQQGLLPFKLPKGTLPLEILKLMLSVSPKNRPYTHQLQKLVNDAKVAL